MYSQHTQLHTPPIEQRCYRRLPCTQVSQSGWETESTMVWTNARLRGYSRQLTYQCGLKSSFACVESFPIENSKMIKSHFLAIFRLSWQTCFFTLRYLFSRRITHIFLSVSAHLAFLQSYNMVEFFTGRWWHIMYFNAWVHTLHFYSTIKKYIVSCSTLLQHVAVKSDVVYNK